MILKARYKDGRTVYLGDQVLGPGARAGMVTWVFGPASPLGKQFSCSGPGVMVEEDCGEKKESRVFDVTTSLEWPEVTLVRRRYAESGPDPLDCE